MAPVPLPLLVWFSPAFPVGAFAYSHGLEWAVEAGDIRDEATLRDWLADVLALGGPWNDSVLLGAAWRAASLSDQAALAEANDLAIALASSRERHLETTAQGNAFLAAAEASWPCKALELLRSAILGDVAYPIALGVTASGHGLALDATLEAFGLAFISNLVSAAVRLGPIGQTAGQRIIAVMMHDIRARAHRAAMSTLDDLGGFALRSDIASMKHETQYSRLFRS